MPGERTHKLMASPAQITANRANARHSTGPRSPEGKARCAHNALRHGLTAAHLVVREDERGRFEDLRAGLIEELDPQGAVETLVFNELLHAAWNLDRFRRLEAERGPQAIENDASREFMDRLARYQARTQRAFYRALQELRTLQTNRALRSLKLTEEEEDAVPAMTDINELTKQTQSEVTAEALELAVKMVDYEAGAFTLKAIRDRAAASPSVAASR